VQPLERIAWDASWLAPWQAPGRAVAARAVAGEPLDEALNALAPAPVRFVPQSQLPAGAAYEQFIAASGCCPTRPGLHDFFHGLVWHAFPRAKTAFNQLQARAIAEAGVGPRRGAVRDALTVFDENGALLQAPPALWEALRERRWRQLFIELRPLWAQARLLVFGHALLEQLVVPRKGLTAHVWCADAPLGDGLAAADAWLAGRCSAEALAAKPFTPLPVLGVPGWWSGNENFSFYDDSLVFRPRRTTKHSSAESTTPARP
jgi:hypothetical protein